MNNQTTDYKDPEDDMRHIRINFPLLERLALTVMLGSLLVFFGACQELEEIEDEGAEENEEETEEETGDDDTAAEDECSEPIQLTSLAELMDALESGHQVRATLYYGQCTLNGGASIDAIGGMNIETYEWFAQGSIGNFLEYVAFSKSSLILLYNEHVYDYVKVRVYSDGSVGIIAEYLDPETWAVEMYEEFECELDQGDGGSVTLYAY